MGDAPKYINFSSTTLFYHVKLPSEASTAMYLPMATDKSLWGSPRRTNWSIEEQFSMLCMNSTDQLKIHLWFLLERNGVAIEIFSFTVLREEVNSVWVILHTTDFSSDTEQPCIHLETLILNGTLTWRWKISCWFTYTFPENLCNQYTGHTQECDPKGLGPMPEC